MPRPRIYEDVDKEMKLEELVKMACDLFGPPYCCCAWKVRK